MTHRRRRQVIKPNISGERTLAALWAPRTVALELFAANRMTITEITRAYTATFPPSKTRAQILRSMRQTQGVVVAQTAQALNVSQEDIRQRTGVIQPDEALISEIELGLSRMLLTWQLDYSRAQIAPTISRESVRADAHQPSHPITAVVQIPASGSTQEALYLLALEAIRRPTFGADAAASLVNFPPTTIEKAEALRIATLAELALFAVVPSVEMLAAVDLVTERVVYTEPQRTQRATNAQTRLSRRTVTQTQATTSKDVQTSMGITGYQWVSQRDGRVRPLHVTLDAQSRAGKVYSWSNPDTKGEGNPGDPYGCRCVAVPVINGETPFVPEVARLP